eukprot:s1616_g16.t1
MDAKNYYFLQRPEDQLSAGLVFLAVSNFLWENLVVSLNSCFTRLVTQAVSQHALPSSKKNCAGVEAFLELRKLPPDDLAEHFLDLRRMLEKLSDAELTKEFGDLREMLDHHLTTQEATAREVFPKLPPDVLAKHFSGLPADELAKHFGDLDLAGRLPELLEDKGVASAAGRNLGELSLLDFAHLKLPPAFRCEELKRMHRESVKLTNMAVEVRCGILMLSSSLDEESKQVETVDLNEESAKSGCPELPKDIVSHSTVFKLTPEEMGPLTSGPTIKSSPRIASGLHSVHSSRASDENTGDDGSQRWHLLISARFNKPQRMTFLKDFQRALEKRYVPVYMVDVTPRQSFGMPTMRGLYHAKMMAAVYTEDYGQVTGAVFETFHELRYAWDKKLKIIPLRLCEQYPPKPPDEEGQIQNDYVLSKSLLYIDAKKLSVDEVANKLAQAWRHPP